MRKAALVVVFLLVIVAAYEVLTLSEPPRAVYLALTSVPDIDASCVFADITDLVQAAVMLDTLYSFSAHELVSLRCSYNSSEYSVMVYLDVSPFEKRAIENALPEPTATVSNRSVYMVSDGNYFVPISSEFYFYSFNGMGNHLSTINDSLNLRNPYPLEEQFSMLARIPDQVPALDSTLRQIRTEFGTTRSVVKEWYVGTTALASTTAYVILREPKDPDLILGCADENSTYDNVTTPYGMLYTCRSGNMCGPKYLVMEDSVAYTQVPMVCDSVEDVFTTAVLNGVTESSVR